MPVAGHVSVAGAGAVLVLVLVVRHVAGCRLPPCQAPAGATG